MSDLAGRGPLGQKTGKPVNGTAAGKAHMAQVAQLRCVCCGAWPVSVHHCRSNGQLKDDFKTIPLCYTDHQGERGYHTDKAAWEGRHGLDTGFLPLVAALLNPAV